MAANSGENRVTGKLADHLVSWCKIECQLEGLLTDDVQISDTRVTQVWDSHYRVNLYQKYLPPTNSLVPDYRIIASYLLECRDGKMIYNRTRRPSSALND